MAIPAFKNEAGATARVLKKIRLRPQDLVVAEAISREMGTSLVVARVLAARGFSPGEELANYISPTLRNGLPDPACLKNLDLASKLIAECHAKGITIAIC